MTLLATLASRRPLRAPESVALNKLISSANRVHDRWPDVVPTTAERDREAIVARIAGRIRGADWDDCTLTMVTRAARVVFSPDFVTRDDLADIRKFYTDETRASDRPGFLSAMMTVYVETYDPSAEHTKHLAAALKKAKPKLGSRWQHLITSIPEILDPKNAPNHIAERMTEMVSPYFELKECGIRSPHTLGLMDHAHLAFLKAIEPTLKHQAGVEHLFSWLRPEGLSPRASGATQAIEAVLQHWTKTLPSDDFQEFVITNLMSFYGDPRVSRGGPWGTVNSDLMALVIRWLTGANIEFFLDVVSRVQKSHMWPARREFWLSLHRKGRIDAAWVAFSGAGVEVARDLQRSGGGRDAIAYGRQVAGAGRRDTSLLIMKFGNCIVVEGSHSYKAHIFRSSLETSPKLFQSRYDCERIRNLPHEEAIVHNGNWQDKVKREIEYVS